MSTLLVHGYNGASGSTNKLIANSAGYFRAYNSSSSLWETQQGQFFDASTFIDSENFLDYAFFVNGINSNLSYNGSWSTSANLLDSPKAKYIKSLGVSLYLGNVIIPQGGTFRSRVVYSDPPTNNVVVWGLESGADLSQTISTAVITSAGSLFKTRGIAVGDPFYITSGTNAGEYVINSVDSETQITLTKTLAATQTNSSFWCGGNWFDVNTDDGDVLTGFGRNSNEIIIFKRNSVHRYSDRASTLRQVKSYPGTGSFRSIVDLNEYTYYYDPSSNAIRRYDGSDCLIVSNAVEDLLQNMSSAIKDNVVGWATNGKVVEMYIGDTSDRFGNSITNCVLMLDTSSQIWSTRSLPFAIDSAGSYILNSRPDTYVGTPTGKVLMVDNGYKYDTNDISFELQDKVIFPEGSDISVNFDRIRLFIENGLDVQVMYRLMYIPISQNTWKHGEWESLVGTANGDMVEFVFPTNKPRRSTGIQFKLIQSSGDESFLLEKYILYYSNPALR